jgi:replication factor C small subunit
MAGEVQVWTEKYRPRTLSEVIGQKHVAERLKSWVKAGNIPNMLFAGPAGVGKTTTALCLARDLFGEHWKENFQETNASVTPETPIMVRKKGKIARTNFGRLANEYFVKDEKYAKATGLEILSIGKSYKVGFRPVSIISRHKVGKIARIKYEGGEINTSLNHSIMVFDESGNLISVEAGKLKKGDLLITFKNQIGSSKPSMDFEKHENLWVSWKNARFKNPKIKSEIKNMPIDEDLSWLFGVYLAEGCANLKPSGTNGCVIFTVSHKEGDIAERIGNVLDDKFSLPFSIEASSSGFDRSRFTSLQVRTYNTQLSRFFLENFYDGVSVKNAWAKRVPSFIYESDNDNKTAFLKGYAGDACGEWGKCLRYSSVSRENLIDIAWLGRIAGLDTSYFGTEARIIWKAPTYSWLKSELVPSEPFIKFLRKSGMSGMRCRNILRHQLYSKKCTRISKGIAKDLLNIIPENQKTTTQKLANLIESPLSAVKITDIKIEGFSDYVYDVSVPDSEMFWGGTTPVLLHNSDERGIDVVRGRIKDFAMMKPLGSDFKIVFLDEADALTPEAQQALRRTMEKFASVCRFILSVNYSGRVIEPIQSRCAVFRFKGLSEENVAEYLHRIVKGENLSADDGGLKAVFETSEGDLRKASNILQAASAMGKVTREVVYDVVSQAKPDDVARMVRFAVDGKFPEARKILLDMLFHQGLSGEDIIREIHRQLFSTEMPEPVRARLLEKTGEFEFRLNQGGSDDIQLEALLAQFGTAGK